jgi:hypothetical protein
MRILLAKTHNKATYPLPSTSAKPQGIDKGLFDYELVKGKVEITTFFL